MLPLTGRSWALVCRRAARRWRLLLLMVLWQRLLLLLLLLQRLRLRWLLRR
jgi:hypothetical protein